MALPGNRDLTNRKILLEELELNKKLLKQGVVNPVNTPAVGNTQGVNAQQNTPLNIPQSYGYYISQDSSFGNSILPVLPRFDVKK